MVSSLPRMLTGRLSLSYHSSEVWIFHYIIFHQLSQYSPGTTTTYLQQAHHHAADGASEKYNLTWDQVTAEVIQKYLRERRSYSKRKNIIKRENQIVKFYKELRDWSNSLTLTLTWQARNTSRRWSPPPTDSRVDNQEVKGCFEYKCKTEKIKVYKNIEKDKCNFLFQIW